MALTASIRQAHRTELALNWQALVTMHLYRQEQVLANSSPHKKEVADIVAWPASQVSIALGPLHMPSMVLQVIQALLAYIHEAPKAGLELSWWVLIVMCLLGQEAPSLEHLSSFKRHFENGSLRPHLGANGFRPLAQEFFSPSPLPQSAQTSSVSSFLPALSPSVDSVAESSISSSRRNSLWYRSWTFSAQAASGSAGSSQISPGLSASVHHPSGSTTSSLGSSVQGALQSTFSGQSSDSTSLIEYLWPESFRLFQTFPKLPCYRTILFIGQGLRDCHVLLFCGQIEACNELYKPISNAVTLIFRGSKDMANVGHRLFMTILIPDSLKILLHVLETAPSTTADLKSAVETLLIFAIGLFTACEPPLVLLHYHPVYSYTVPGMLNTTDVSIRRVQHHL
ncbi:hypothetical protein G5714_012321 [Onychostoma macrolepis]|uniref:Uncharacterized protein n=1 Tax=Onychostoma macrolepis TaxID=369639 RepID=A0A7J6CGR5_9TELE|nr:hypothetical protein G5714_012321 [Onychostoma macrolepis]